MIEDIGALEIKKEEVSMRFVIKNGELIKIENMDNVIHVPDDVTLIKQGAFFDSDVKIRHIYLPGTVEGFEETAYGNSFDVSTNSKGLIITMPSSVYQRIDEDTLYNYESPYPYREDEIRFDIVKKDGSHIELYYVQFGNDEGFSTDNFWFIEDVESLTEADFDEYDSSVLDEDEFSKDHKVRTCLSRLLRPYMLSDDNKKAFVLYVKANVDRALKYVIEHDDKELFELLFEIKAITSKDQIKLKSLVFASDAPLCQAFWDSIDAKEYSTSKSKQIENTSKNKKLEAKLKKDGYKSNDILPSKDLYSRKYDVLKINDNEYQTLAIGSKQTVMECNGYFSCDCHDYKKAPQNCGHIVAVKRFLNDPFVLYKKPHFKIVLNLSKNAPKEERLNEIAAQLKEAYQGVKTYYLKQIENEQPNISINTLRTLVKAVYNISLVEYLQSIGILTPTQSYDVTEDYADIEDLKGKNCCVFYTPYISNFNRVLTTIGAKIVSSDSSDIDYVFMNEKEVLKDPPSDNKEMVDLFKRREEKKVKFKILSLSFFQNNYAALKNVEQTVKEELAAEELANIPPQTIYEIKNNIDFSKLPKYNSDKIYWSLSYFKNWFGVANGYISGDLTKYSKGIDLDDPNLVESSFLRFQEVAKHIDSVEIQNYICELANNEKWTRSKQYMITPVGYIDNFFSHKAIMAQILEDNVISVYISSLELAVIGENEGYDLTPITLFEMPPKLADVANHFDSIVASSISDGKNNHSSVIDQKQTERANLESKGGLSKNTVSNPEMDHEEELRKIREDNEQRARENQERQTRIEAEERKKREEEDALRKAKEVEQDKALEAAYLNSQEDAERRKREVKIKASSTSKLSSPSLDDFKMQRNEILGYKGRAGNVTLPPKYTKVAEKAFANNDRIIILEIPSGYKKIEKKAFDNCSKLREVRVAPGVQIIDDYAFSNCVALESIEISEGISELSDCLFYNCKKLKGFIIPQTVNKITASVFANCESLQEICIPYGVTSIGMYAFASCAGLRDVYIPSTVKMIGKEAFMDCNKFTLHVEKGSRAEKYAIENNYFYDYDINNKIMMKSKAEYQTRLEEESARKAQEEAEHKAREEAERKAQEEEERKVREEAERQAREEAERKKREEIERICREAEERRLRTEAERKAQEEAERKAREEERKARAEAERKLREEEEHKAKEEAERKEREEEERKAREEAERKAREESERLEQERIRSERRAKKLCQHCGGTFKGLFTKKCSNCGMKKDY